MVQMNKIEYSRLDFDYLRELVLSQEPESLSLLNSVIDTIIYGQTIFYEGTRAGVFYFSQYDDIILFNAYKDKRNRIPIRYSIEAGEHALSEIKQYTNLPIHSSSLKENTLQSLALSKLQFKQVDEFEYNGEWYQLFKRDI